MHVDRSGGNNLPQPAHSLPQPILSRGHAVENRQRPISLDLAEPMGFGELACQIEDADAVLRKKRGTTHGC